MEEHTKVVSSFFSNETPISTQFLDLIDELNHSLEQFNLPEAVQCVYNPTVYARHTFEKYVRKYCNTKKQVIYFGMNPGPWGMSQTGVPFGEICSVRDWMQIEGPVEKPSNEISARPVNGFDCTRTEVSGKRFWGLFKGLCGSPENFFHTSFVYNYLPQQWMKSNGCNLTPGDFKVTQMNPLFAICDPIFVKVLKLYDVKTIVAIGKFCETRAQKALNQYLPESSIEIVYLPHPSPRSVNNNNWDVKAVDHLKQFNLLKHYKRLQFFIVDKKSFLVTRSLTKRKTRLNIMVEFMNRALELAEEALAAQEVPVGCIFIADGEIIAESRNTVNITRNPTRHAEMNCIDDAIQYCKDRGLDYHTLFKKITVYVTVEPCIMCAAALNNLSVKEVVYGCANDRFGGKTVLDISSFFDKSYTLTGNLLADEAMSLLKQFYKGTNPNAPASKVKKKKEKV